MSNTKETSNPDNKEEKIKIKFFGSTFEVTNPSPKGLIFLLIVLLFLILIMLVFPSIIIPRWLLK